MEKKFKGIKTTGDRIKELRKAKGLTQEAFAKLVGLKTAINISRYENNKRKHNISILVNIAQRCNISLDWLITGIGDMNKQGGMIGLEVERKLKTKIPTKIPLRPIPVLNSIPAGYPETPIDDCIMDWVLIPVEFKDPKAFALIVTGESMSPKINDGDIVIISPNIRTYSGQIGAFRINGDVTIKKYLKKKGMNYLIPENDEYPPIICKGDDELIDIGRVVYQLKKL